MNSIVERLIEADKNSVQAANGNRIFGEAAERIKELEETLETSRAAAESYERRLAALRQRIADAPAIGKVTTFGFGVCKDEPVFSWLVANPPIGETLISKEDLQK